jgi:hypothetical protein
MRWTTHQNAQFKWGIGDLNDIVALGTAGAYCNIVVCEKHWGSILQRHELSYAPRVLTSPPHLADHI